MSEPAFLSDAHFWTGSLAVISGFTAFAARKGRRVHRAAGMIFVIAMAALTASGLWLSIARNILFTVFLSAIAFHAFATGWAAARLETLTGKLATRVSPLISASIVLGAAYGGVRAAATPEGVLNDLPPDAFYIVAGVGSVIFIFDLVFATAENPTEQRRLTRHLWRMGFSFFLATAIFFFGNNHVLPEALRILPVLSAPVITVLLWTIYYAFRTRLSDIGYARRRRRPAPPDLMPDEEIGDDLPGSRITKAR